MTLLQSGLAKSLAADAYTIDNSLRFEGGDSAYLSRTAGTATSNDIGTFSFWYKKGEQADAQGIFSNYSDSSNRTYINFDLDNLQMFGKISGSTNVELITTAKYRDPSAWYHFVIAVDVTQVTASDRVKVYVNNVRETSFSTETYPAQNTDLPLFSKTNMHIGARFATSLGDYCDGYLADFYYIDGTAELPSVFGELNSTTNQWIPKDASGLTFGTNGFYQKYGGTELATSFTDSSEETYTVAAGKTSLEVLVVAGGGSGGGYGGGGAGAGGIVHHSSLAVTAGQVISLSVGAGGAETVGAGGEANQGENSTFGDITALGGGRGWRWSTTPYSTSGGSGSGACAEDANRTGGAATQGDSGGGTGYGNAGGNNNHSFPPYTAGGGGGAGAVGVAGGSAGGNGGAGQLFSNFTSYGVSGYFGGGGGGGVHQVSTPAAGSGGTGGGGAGSNTASRATAGTALTGGGGGGGWIGSSDSGGGAGGSGTIIVYDGTTYTQFAPPSRPHTITANGDVTNTRAVRKVGDSSIKFDGTGDYLSIPNSSDWDFGTGNFTLEAWVNTSDTSTATNEGIFGNRHTDGEGWEFKYRPDEGKFKWYDSAGATELTDVHNISDGSWHHIAVVREGTGTDEFVWYVDGTATFTGTLAANLTITGANVMKIGAEMNLGTGQFWNGYMDEVRVSDSARYTSSFTPSTTEFTADANTMLLIHSNWDGGLGADSSGNYNTFTPTNLVATDQMIDVPTNNFATMNPINANSNLTFKEGNLEVAGTSGGQESSGTFAVDSGKWYFECYMDGVSGTNNFIFGIADISKALGVLYANGMAYMSDGQKYLDSTSPSSYGATFATGDVMSVTMNLDDDEWTFYKNDATQGAVSFTQSGRYFTPFIRNGASGDSAIFNFGADSSFAGNKTAQGNQDGNDIGDFYYTPPTDYLALCTDNLSAPEIALPGENFNPVIYTGAGYPTAVTGVGFQPDFVWIKRRNAVTMYDMFDAVRGGSSILDSASNGAAATIAGALTFDSDGFTAAVDPSSGDTGSSGNTFVSWNWKAGGATTVTNTDGDEESEVSVDNTSGISILTYSGTLSASGSRTVGHGMNVAPELIISKSTNVSGSSWAVQVPNELTSSSYILRLDLTGAEADKSGNGTLSAPTASVFYTNYTDGLNVSGSDCIAYCFASIEGYSKVGRYEGNNNADGPFIYTGFKPAFVMIKGADQAGSSWFLLDNKRDPYNAVDRELYADNPAAEGTGNGTLDFLSNGFKCRGSDSINYASTMIYIAVAESPFKTANAR